MVIVNFVMKKSMSTKRLQSPHCHLPSFSSIFVSWKYVFFLKNQVRKSWMPSLYLNFSCPASIGEEHRYELHHFVTIFTVKYWGVWRNRPIGEVNIAMAYWDHPRYRKLLGSSPIYPPIKRPPSPTLEDPHYLRTRTRTMGWSSKWGNKLFAQPWGL